jgi:hypothetical protein
MTNPEDTAAEDTAAAETAADVVLEGAVKDIAEGAEPFIPSEGVAAWLADALLGLHHRTKS